MPSFPDLAQAIHAWLGRTRALITLVQLDDLLGERLPVNVPGDAGSTNWRRRHALSIEELERAPLFERLTTVLAAQRLLAARRYTS
jgi:4-alpha-glucanotransferase